MKNIKDKLDRLNGFSKLNFHQRHQLLIETEFLTAAISEKLHANQAIDVQLAEKMIENVIGIYAFPLGVAVNFVIDDKPYIIPMAIEETSIVASASKTAKFIQQNGTIKTDLSQWEGTGQIQYSKIQDMDAYEHYIDKNKSRLLAIINDKLLAKMVERGGGASEIYLRVAKRPDGANMGILHVHINTCDAMGANKINQCCEYLSRIIYEETNEQASMCILTNLAKRKLVKATVTIDNISQSEAKRIEEASIFAELDPFRATTSNKGVLNAIDAILIATGNDWRAVEAGIHAYACRSGQYQPITRWYVQGQSLIGELEAPIDVGLKGGLTNVHPIVQASIAMLNIRKATELARIVAAAGLVQNLAALRALTSEGITQGHMRLHIPNLLENIRCSQEEKELLKKELEKLLKKQGYINSEDIKRIQSQLKNGE